MSVSILFVITHMNLFLFTSRFLIWLSYNPNIFGWLIIFSNIVPKLLLVLLLSLVQLTSSTFANLLHHLVNFLHVVTFRLILLR